jgi:anti-sigma-K factor RskA
VRTLREKVLTHYEGRKGLKDLGGGRPRYLKKLQLESGVNVIKTYEKTTGLVTVKRIAGSLVGLQMIRDWTLRRGQPPQKRKTKRKRE